MLIFRFENSPSNESQKEVGLFATIEEENVKSLLIRPLSGTWPPSVTWCPLRAQSRWWGALRPECSEGDSWGRLCSLGQLGLCSLWDLECQGCRPSYLRFRGDNTVVETEEGGVLPDRFCLRILGNIVSYSVPYQFFSSSSDSGNHFLCLIIPLSA